MRYRWWVLGAVVGLLAGCGATGAEQRDDVTEQIDGAVSRVEVDSDAGNLRLVAGTQARVEQDLRWTGDARPEVTHRLDGEVLRVEARCPDRGSDRCQAGLVITVPEASSSRAELSAGAIEIEGLTGEHEVRTSAGGVQGRGLGPGSVTAESSAGSVDLTFVAAAPEVTAESSAGSVDVRVPDGQDYAVDAETTAGQTRVELADTPGAPHRITARSSAGGVTVGHG
ncbi:DUF4097 family beta strand repeat-containing protein [Pseudonocardia nematodicida]|uniref:DUF4097 family beta strand repeat-containing protein n=1 Tax=Pseudonocardia nematodicida TaxID=1206997 RepID=A0ABV1K5F4_9PSEU